MPTFDFKADMDNVFLDSGFQESISYLPSGGVAATINAIVDRGAGEAVSGPAGNLKLMKSRVTILVSKTDVPVVTVQADKVTLTHGERTNDRMSVSGILYEDDGAFLLGLS